MLLVKTCSSRILELSGTSTTIGGGSSSSSSSERRLLIIFCSKHFKGRFRLLCKDILDIGCESAAILVQRAGQPKATSRSRLHVRETGRSMDVSFTSMCQIGLRVHFEPVTTASGISDKIICRISVGRHRRERRVLIWARASSRVSAKEFVTWRSCSILTFSYNSDISCDRRGPTSFSLNILAVRIVQCMIDQ